MEPAPLGYPYVSGLAGAKLIRIEMKLLLVVNIAEFFLSHRLPIARAALESGFEVHVATSQSPAVEEIVRRGFVHHPIPIQRWTTNPLLALKSIRALYRLYKKLKPDLVHHVTIKPVLYGSLAARLAKIPAVVNAVTGMGHVFSPEGFKAKLIEKMARGVYKISFLHPRKRFILQNPDDRRALLAFGGLEEKETVIIKGSGVDTDRFQAVPEPGAIPVALCATRMLREKGVFEFVQAAQKLKEMGVRARFVLVGDREPGNPYSISSSQLKQWHEGNIVEWWGHRTDMNEVFAQANIVCLPTFYREGVPKVLIEAAACGRAIVASEVAGCREIVRPGVNGFLAPVRQIEPLAQALKELIENPDLRREMGQKGRQIALQEFSEKIVVKKTLALYEELLGEGKTAGTAVPDPVVEEGVGNSPTSAV